MAKITVANRCAGTYDKWGCEVKFSEKLLCLTWPLLATVASGCSPAYHSYSRCRVPCKYGAPSPLPYTQYGGCPCHSKAAERYLFEGPLAVSDVEEAEADAPNEWRP